MAALPAARMGDPFADGDFIAQGSGDVMINGIPAARLGDPTTGHGPPPCFWPPTLIDKGSGSVLINGIPAARMTDTHAVHCCGPACHNSMIVQGSGDVLIG